MIDSSLSGWLGLAALVALAHAAGLALSRSLRWTPVAQAAGLPAAAGHGLGPLLAGLASVLVLGLLPGASHRTHLMAIFALLALPALAGASLRKPGAPAGPAGPTQFGTPVIGLFIALWVGALLVNAIFLPMTQNDSLEYAIVGRILYASSDLASYPALDPTLNSSGFFGPWTHPPLYVAMVYTMNLLQGHVNSPGLMQLVSPWFALATTGLVYSTGRMQSRRCGALAVLLCVSTPLLFTSANTALIDSLPVLGLALVCVAILGLDARSRWAGAAIGLMLGLALWTHSQAVLFPALALVLLVVLRGATNLGAWPREFALAMLAAALVAAWPYLRNTQLFGSLISDNPAVFAMPELGWSEYFRISRGLDNAVSIVQYGVFKGWFAVKSFGWTFWLMAAALPVLLSRLPAGALVAPLRGGAGRLEAGQQAMAASLTITLTYLGGVVASVVLGLDLMIKNDRYTLVIVPAVSLLAAGGLDLLLGAGVPARAARVGLLDRRRVYLVAVSTAVALLLFHFLFVAWQYTWRLVPSTRADVARSQDAPPFANRFEAILDNLTNVRAARWIDRMLPADAVILSMRPADLYYSRQRMVSHLDPRLLPIYREADPQRALAQLRALGVSHIQMTDYGLPVTYGSVLGRLIAAPEMSTLIYAAGGTQVYSLGDSGKRVVRRTDITPTGSQRWSQWKQHLFPGLGALFRLTRLSDMRPYTGELSDTVTRLPLFDREFSTFLVAGAGPSMGDVNPGVLPPIRPGGEYRLSLALEGHAQLRVWITQFDHTGRLISETTEAGATRIDEQVMVDARATHFLSRRFIALPQARWFAIGVEHLGYSAVRIGNASLEEFAAQ